MKEIMQLSVFSKLAISLSVMSFRVSHVVTFFSKTVLIFFTSGLGLPDKL